MDKDTIFYATVDERIEKLKKQGLIINSLDFARSELALYGYSNLIKSYRDPYTIMSEGSKRYRSGVTFEQIQSLYILDKKLRNAVMASMLDLEEYVKEDGYSKIEWSCLEWNTPSIGFYNSIGATQEQGRKYFSYICS